MALSASMANAASYFLDTDGNATNGLNNSGAASWGTATVWYNSSTTKILAWSSGNDAIIGGSTSIGAPGTLSIDRAISAVNVTVGYSGATGTWQIPSSAKANSLTFSGTLTIYNGATFNTVLAGAGSVVIDGGTMLNTGATTATTFAKGTWTGTTTVKNGGTLNAAYLGGAGLTSDLGSSAADAVNLVLDNGTISYSGTVTGNSNKNFTIGTGGATFTQTSTGRLTMSSTAATAFTGTGARTVTLGGTSDAVNQFGAALGDQDLASGKTSLTKTGDGTWVLNGATTYTGTTNVSAGTLQVATAASMTMDVGSSQVKGPGLIDMFGTLNLLLPGVTPAAGTTYVLFAGPSTFESSFNVAGFTETNNVWSNGTYSFSEATGILSVSPAPEPTALAGMAIAGLLMLRRRGNVL